MAIEGTPRNKVYNNSFLTEWKVHYKRLLSAGESNKYSRTSADWSWNVPGLGLASFVSYLIYFIRNSTDGFPYNCCVARVVRDLSIVRSGLVKHTLVKWAVHVTIDTDPYPQNKFDGEHLLKKLKDTKFSRNFRPISFKLFSNIFSCNTRWTISSSKRNHHYLFSLKAPNI